MSRCTLGDRRNALDPVVHEEDLAAPVELPAHRILEDLVRPRQDVRDDRHPVPRRGADQREVAQPRDREVERPRDRRRRQREDVEVALQLLETLLVLDAEALLLVDDQEPEVVEDDVGLEEPMRPDDDVDLPRGEPEEDLLLFLPAAEPAQRLHADRVVGETFAEGVQVLLGEDRRRRQHGDLLSVPYGLEGGADGDLRFAVADVAAEETVHGAARLHVPLDVFRSLALVGRILVEEAGLHLFLPARVRGEGETLRELPRRVELEELGRHLPDCRLGLAAQGLPRLATDLVEARRGRLIGVADPTLDQVEAVHGHAQRLAAGVLDGEDPISSRPPTRSARAL